MKLFVVFAIVAGLALATNLNDRVHDMNQEEYNLQDLQRDGKNILQRAGHIWANLVGRGKETLDRIFGANPFWDRTYEFKIPDVFKKFTLEEFSRTHFGAIRNSQRDLEKALSGNLVLLEEKDEIWETPLENLPESYNFFAKYPTCLKKAWNQDRCGSCWAFATAGAMTHRLCKAVVDAGLTPPGNGADNRLSPQMFLSCWDGANDCRGSSTLGAWAWAGKNWVSRAKCAPYDAWSGQVKKELCQKYKTKCSDAAKKGSDRRIGHKVTADTLSYIIGEDSIKRHVYERGPITATMKVPANFIGMSGKGVFSKGNAGWLPSGAMHAMHAVVIFGWGVKDGVKHWMVENSWGEVYWHKEKDMNKGQCLMLRGANDVEFETQFNVAANIKLRLEDDKVVDVKDGWNIAGGTPVNLAVDSRRLVNQAEEVIDEAKQLLNNESEDNHPGDY